MESSSPSPEGESGPSGPGIPQNGLHGLPNEIQDIIYKHVSEDDLKALRLVCKRTRQSATALLFQRIDILPFEDCFEWITDEIRQHVRCVRYISKFLPDVETMEEYYSKFVGTGFGMDHETNVKWKQQLDHSILKESWDMYCWYRESQLILLQEGQELAALTDLFSGLPRLREIQLLSSYNEDDGGDFDQLFKPPLDLASFHPIARETLINLKSFHEFADVLPKFPDHVYERHLRVLLVAAKRSNRQIERLLVDDLDPNVFDSIPSGNQFEQYIGSLKQLEVSFNAQSTSSSRRFRKRLRDLIHASANLETLAINPGMIFEEMYNPVQKLSLTDLITSDLREPKTPHHWPRLHKLVLHSFQITLPIFLDFLTRHAPTLRRLELFDIDLILTEPVSWDDEPASFKDLFKGIRERAKITEFEIGGTLSNLDEEAWEVADDEVPPGFALDSIAFPQTLKGRVQAFVVQGGPKWDFGPEDKDFEQGDWSWVILTD